MCVCVRWYSFHIYIHPTDSFWILFFFSFCFRKQEKNILFHDLHRKKNLHYAATLQIWVEKNDDDDDDYHHHIITNRMRRKNFFYLKKMFCLFDHEYVWCWWFDLDVFFVYVYVCMYDVCFALSLQSINQLSKKKLHRMQ